MATKSFVYLHQYQNLVYQAKSRFKVVVAGRRWGKSQLSKAMILKYAKVARRLVWYVAPSYRMAKDIMWPELKYSLPRKWVKRVNETSLEMTLINDTRIALRGADNPDSLRGVGVHFLVMDEVQDINPEAWTKVLRPTLASTGGHALFIGCVRGDTKILKRDGITEIGSLSKTKIAKTLEDIDLELYGIDREYHKADGFWNNGIVKTKRITTHNGFSIESSLPHPLLVMGKDGVPCWKKTESITTDDYVAIGMGMEQWGNKDPLDGFQNHIENWRKEQYAGKNGPRSKELTPCK